MGNAQDKLDPSSKEGQAFSKFVDSYNPESKFKTYKSFCKLMSHIKDVDVLKFYRDKLCDYLRQCLDQANEDKDYDRFLTHIPRMIYEFPKPQGFHVLTYEVLRLCYDVQLKYPKDPFVWVNIDGLLRNHSQFDDIDEFILKPFPFRGGLMALGDFYSRSSKTKTYIQLISYDIISRVYVTALIQNKRYNDIIELIGLSEDDEDDAQESKTKITRLTDFERVAKSLLVKRVEADTKTDLQKLNHVRDTDQPRFLVHVYAYYLLELLRNGDSFRAIMYVGIVKYFDPGLYSQIMDIAIKVNTKSLVMRAFGTPNKRGPDPAIGRQLFETNWLPN